jgi:hypothetical protein
MKKYVFSLAVLMTASLPSLAIAGNAEQANGDMPGVVQLSDEEMDNVSAAGLAIGKANAPGQQLKALRLTSTCDKGKSCSAPGKNKLGSWAWASNARAPAASLLAVTNRPQRTYKYLTLRSAVSRELLTFFVESNPGPGPEGAASQNPGLHSRRGLL